MKIEVGKFYKTRSGRKARIYATDGIKNYVVHGAMLTKDGWCRESWDIVGRNLEDFIDHRDDLVSEWVDPVEDTCPMPPLKCSNDVSYGLIVYGYLIEELLPYLDNKFQKLAKSDS